MTVRLPARVRRPAVLALAGLLLGGAASAGEPSPAFARKPTATKAGDGKVKIEFAVDRETDAAIFIEDGAGKVVRHLAAGVLGANAPAPLKPGLAQSLEWDGKADWGKAAPAGPFRVRVALGLGARYDKVVATDPESLNKIAGLGVGPDGTLYVAAMVATHTVHNDGIQLVTLNRDGTYQRTLIPVPADVSREQLAFLGGAAVEVGGRLAPAISHLNGHETVDFRPDRGTSLAVAPGGLLLVPQGEYLGAVPLGRDVPPGRYAGARVAGGKGADLAAAAVSGDGQWAYACGNRGRMSGSGLERIKASAPAPAVYRLKLPERTESAVFFGDPARPGSDEKHLASPCALALDGRGHLLVADRENNRVVAVAEKDGAFAGSLSVDKPEGLAADPKSGAVYVLCDRGKRSAELVKFSGWKDAKVLAKATLTINTREGASLALDASANPPVAWVGCYYQLLRIEDGGDKFGAPVAIGKGKSGKFGLGSFEDVTVDRYRDDPEIYARRGHGNGWTRFNEVSGKLETFIPDGKCIYGPAGTCIVPGPGGNIYALCQTIPAMFKFDRSGKALAWDDPHPPERDLSRPGVKDAEERYIQRYAAGKLPPYAVFTRVCMGYMTHTMGVRPDGHVFVFERGAKLDHRANKALYQYEPSGRKLETPVIWNVSDNVVGPKFDQDGNIYIAEQIRPADRFVPPEYAGFVGPLKVGGGGASADARRQVAVTMYGSILKFTPKGGTIEVMDAKAGKPHDGEPQLAPGLKTQDAVWGTYGNLKPTRVVGAEWIHLGASHVNIDYCNCEHINFDVDPFGRVWYPDIGRYRIDVLDTAGNELAHFGGYGNADSKGPESSDKKLSEPEIAFAWPLGVAATDRYAYVGDPLNRRLLRARLVYAAEETCEVR